MKWSQVLLLKKYHESFIQFSDRLVLEPITVIRIKNKLPYTCMMIDDEIVT